LRAQPDWVVPPLIRRDRARIELARGRQANVEGAIQDLLAAREFFGQYGDPDGVTTVDRLLFEADRSRFGNLLREDIQAARLDGRHSERIKLKATGFGFGTHGWAAPLVYRVNDLSGGVRVALEKGDVAPRSCSTSRALRERFGRGQTLLA
jgi:hypothetical protein